MKILITQFYPVLWYISLISQAKIAPSAPNSRTLSDYVLSLTHSLP